MVLQREDRIKTERFSKIAQLQMFLVHSNIRSSCLGEDAERYADLHGRLLRDWGKCVRMPEGGRELPCQSRVPRCPICCVTGSRWCSSASIRRCTPSRKGITSRGGPIASGRASPAPF